MILMYLRKSRADDSSMTVEDVLAKHESILQEYCVKNYGAALDKQYIYREVVSGETIADRPEMRKILERITNEDVEGVLVVEPQRLSRGDMLDCGTIIRVFKYSNTKIITPNKAFDLADKYDEMFIKMELQRGNDYLEYTKTILARGRIASVKKGCYLGNTAPYGYDKTKIDKLPTLVPNNEAPYVKLMFELCLKGYGSARIANELTQMGIKPRRSANWSAATIKDILKNETYIGKVRWSHRSGHIVVDKSGKTRKEHRRNAEYLVVDGLHPAIIDDDTYNKAQAVLGSMTKEVKSTELKNVFAGLIRCNCGYVYTYHTYAHARPRLHCSHQKYCHTPSIAYDDFLADFVDTLKSQIHNMEICINKDDDSTEVKELIESLNKELASIEIKQSRLYSFLENGTYTEDVFAARNTALDIDRQRVLTAIEDLNSRQTTTKEYIVSLYSALDSLMDDNFSAKAKNTLLKSFIDRVEIDSDVHIYFK